MSKRTVPQRVEEFRAKNPKAVKFRMDEMDEIMGLDSVYDRVMNAFYFGYMRGIKKKSGKDAPRKSRIIKMVEEIENEKVIRMIYGFVNRLYDIENTEKRGQSDGL